MPEWKQTNKGAEFELKTATLVLVVRPCERGGWEALVLNTGRYKVLRRETENLTGHVNEAKRVCLSMARDILRDERVMLASVEV